MRLYFLYILLSVIAVIILLLCIRVVAVLNYKEEFTFEVKWLFLKFQIYPKNEKKKKEKPNNEKEKENNLNDTKKKNKSKNRSNPLKAFYINQGFDGVLELIGNTVSAVSGILKRVYKTFIINNLYLGIRISSSDASSTAIQYGKTCATVFPAMGAIYSTVKVRKYEVDIRPDFSCSSNKAHFNVAFSVIPIIVVNAALILAVQLLFKVLIKLFIGSRRVSKSKKIN